MKLGTIAFTLLSLQLLAGCTAVGFVADMAVIKATQDDDAPSQKQALIFTQMGLEADAAVIGGLIKKDTRAKIATESDSPVPPQFELIGICPRTLEKGEPCYSAEYYEQFRKQLAKPDSEQAEDSAIDNQ